MRRVKARFVRYNNYYVAVMYKCFQCRVVEIAFGNIVLNAPCECVHHRVESGVGCYKRDVELLTTVKMFIHIVAFVGNALFFSIVYP